MVSMVAIAPVKASVCGRSLTRIAGSNPSGGAWMCVSGGCCAL